VIFLRRPWHLSQFSVNATEASGRRGNFKCKFRRHLIWRIDRSVAVCTEQRPHGFKIEVGLQRSGYSGNSPVAALFRTEPALQATLHELRTLRQIKLKTAFRCRYRHTNLSQQKLYAVRCQGVSVRGSHLHTQYKQGHIWRKLRGSKPM
jgi:hypothetical protein